MRFRICVSDIRYEVLGYVRKIMWFGFGVDGIGCDMRYEVFGMRSRYMQCVVCGIATRDMGYGASRYEAVVWSIFLEFHRGTDFVVGGMKPC